MFGHRQGIFGHRQRELNLNSCSLGNPEGLLSRFAMSFLLWIFHATYSRKKIDLFWGIVQIIPSARSPTSSSVDKIAFCALFFYLTLVYLPLSLHLLMLWRLDWCYSEVRSRFWSWVRLRYWSLVNIFKLDFAQDLELRFGPHFEGKFWFILWSHSLVDAIHGSIVSLKRFIIQETPFLFEHCPNNLSNTYQILAQCLVNYETVYSSKDHC